MLANIVIFLYAPFDLYKPAIVWMSGPFQKNNGHYQVLSDPEEEKIEDGTNPSPPLRPFASRISPIRALHTYSPETFKTLGSPMMSPIRQDSKRLDDSDYLNQIKSEPLEYPIDLDLDEEEEEEFADLNASMISADGRKGVDMISLVGSVIKGTETPLASNASTPQAKLKKRISSLLQRKTSFGPKASFMSRGIFAKEEDEYVPSSLGLSRKASTKSFKSMKSSNPKDEIVTFSSISSRWLISRS